MTKNVLSYACLVLSALLSAATVYAQDGVPPAAKEIMPENSPETSPETSKESLRIGAVVALTGPAAGWGNKARQGWELAVQEYNDARPKSEPAIELLLEDSGTNAAQGVSAFQKLVSVNRVDAVVGDVWDFLTTPLVPLATSKKSALISTIIPQSTTAQSPYFFPVGPKTPSIRNAVEKFFDLESDIRTVAILGWDNDWGYGYNAIWEEVMRSRGVKLVAKVESIKLDGDWRAEVEQVARLAPDAIFFHHHANQIIKRLHERKLSPKLLTTSNITEELQNGLLNSFDLSNVYFTDWTRSARFTSAFENAYGDHPLLSAADAYDAMQALIAAYKASPKDLVAGMKSVRFDGVTGLFDFSESNAGNHAVAELYRISDGKPVVAELP